MRELMKNKIYWDLAYERMESKGIDISSLYFLKESKEDREKIVDSIFDGLFNVEIPRKVKISKVGTTKKRIVYLYDLRTRYILGVLYRVMSVYYSDTISKLCYSYKRGINTGKAINVLQKSGFEKKYGIKLDISAYFNSVSKEKIIACLDELCKGEVGLRKTLGKLYENDNVYEDGKIISEFKGLIPGCAMGSFFANYCLRDIDFYFENKNIAYARYSDDIIFLVDTQEEIDSNLAVIKEKLNECGLTVNEKKYERFNPSDTLTFLGLTLDKTGIDISEHGKSKVKKLIHRWTKKARKEIELDGKPYEYVVRKLIRRYNYRIYKCYIEDNTKFGWGYYAFRYITKLDSLIELDYYLYDRLRYLKTGKTNKANVKSISKETLQEYGVYPLVDMYKLFHSDFDYYCEVVSLMK